jgi:hypothetical protein
MNDGKIPLADWVDSVRQEILKAQARYATSSDDKALGLALEEVTLEANVLAETTDSGGLKIQLFVFTVEGGTAMKDSLTQKVALKFKPTLQSHRPLTMGDEP